MARHRGAWTARIGASLCAIALAVPMAASDSSAARRDEDAQVCESAMAQYRQGIAIVEQNSGVVDADMAMAQLRQALPKLLTSPA